MGNEQGLEGPQGDAKERKTGPLVPFSEDPHPASCDRIRPSIGDRAASSHGQGEVAYLRGRRTGDVFEWTVQQGLNRLLPCSAYLGCPRAPGHSPRRWQRQGLYRASSAGYPDTGATEEAQSVGLGAGLGHVEIKVFSDTAGISVR